MSPGEIWRVSRLRLLLIAVLFVGILNATRQVNGDTWFNLVLGREIATSGLVHRNELTREAWAVPVVDLQWLAHLCQYGLAHSLGLPGLALVGSLLAYGTLLGASYFALRQGATPGRTLFVGLLALSSFAPQTVRAQTFALPLLLGFLVLAQRDTERPTRRTWWLLPGAALWANLHGSVLLAPALGALALLARVLDAQRAGLRPDLRLLARDAALTLGLAGATLVSPYGLGLIGYYAATLNNPAFRAHVVEWSGLQLLAEPLTSVLPLATLALVLLGFRRVRSFPALVCLCFALLALRSIRHATPLAIAAAVLLPRLADAACGQQLRFESDGRLRGLTSVLLPPGVLAFLLGVPLLAARALRDEFPARFSDRVAAAATGARAILADEYHADRLLWYHPELKGRVSHDVRLEILPREFIESLTLAYGFPDSDRARQWLSKYDLIVVDREQHGPLWASLAGSRQWREVAVDRFATAFRARPAARIEPVAAPPP
jgi:hypothetical protein